MPEVEAVAVEEVFKKLTNSNEVKYEALYPGIGKGAVTSKIVDDGNLAWQATLVRKFDYHNLPKEEVPTGEISSLAYLTQTPAEDKELKAQAVTKISYFGESIEDKVETAITSQKFLRNLIDKQDLDIRNYGYHAADKVTVKNYDGLEESFISITNRNNVGKKPRFPLSIILRDKKGDPNFVQVFGKTDHEISQIIPALDYQINNFERVLGRKVHLPWES